MPTKSTHNSAAPRIRRILVPLDFSGASRQALPAAIALAEKFRARIVLVHVVAPQLQPVLPPAMGMAFTPMPVRGARTQAATQLHERGEKLIPRDLYERSIVSLGHAASEIVAVAERIDADLIVVSTHGHSGVKRFLMGSTAEQIVRHAPCPVMTVRQPRTVTPKKSVARREARRTSVVPPMRAL